MREGSKNGRWIEKVPYVCPHCGKVLMLTPRQAERNTGKKRMCSRACAGAERRGKKRGPNPEAAKRMRENNPMKRPEVAAKQVASLKESYASGKLEDLRAKQRERGKTERCARLREYTRSEEGRSRARRHMIENNPMSDPEVAKKVSGTRKALFASGEWTPPWKGRHKPDAVERMSSDRNPMKDPETRRKTLRKIIASHQKNGISQGERNVRDALEALHTNYIQQFMVDGPKRSYFLDFFLPDNKYGIEYDGHSGHYTEEGIARDKARDDHIRSLMGIRILRIHRDTAFIGIESLAAVIAKGLADESQERL